jgi:N-carbamoyl-D-amino-acid hydrolase
VVVAECDLDRCRKGKDKMFDFGQHRQPAPYGPITERAGVIEPAPVAAE